MQEVKYRVVRKHICDLMPNEKVLIDGESVYFVDSVDRYFKTQTTMVRLTRSLDGRVCRINRFNHFSVDVIQPIEDVTESATTEEPAQPAPETRTITIDGERFTVTREGDGWSKPVPWSPAVGDEVALGELSEGDLVLIPGVFYSKGDRSSVGIRLPQNGDFVTWMQSNKKVIYNGRAE